MIKFEHVEKSFGRKNVLNDLNLHIKKQETVALVGLSGAGKSVTLKHMVRLLTPTAGRVLIDGEAINEVDGEDLARIRSRFGYLFQSAALLQWLDIGENVALPLREHTKMPNDEIVERVRAVLDKVGLLDDYHKFPSDISGGMQKRAGLARAIITEPQIILYDEPTSGLDPLTSRTIDELIMNLQDGLGVTSVVVTHDMISALKVADRIFMLHMGRLEEVNEPEAFLRTDNKVVRSFLDAQHIDPDFLVGRTL